MTLDKYLINKNCSLIEALRQIDANKQGFVIIVEGNGSVFGVLTDGDIRRYLIADGVLNVTIDKIANKDYLSMQVDDNIGKAVELFKNEAVKFLPVLDNNLLITNIITKRKLQVALLLDLKLDLAFDFEQIDENIIDYEIYPRPWGFYKTTVLNDYYQGKVISLKPNGQLSLQSHNHREEHWIIVHGNGKVQLDGSEVIVTCGSSIFIPKGCKHRAMNTDETENLIITEVQIGDYLGEDDIIRYDDIYGRV